MKRTLMYVLVLIVACCAAGCMRDVFNFTDEEEFGITDNAGNGRVVFDNTANTIPVYVYSAQARTEDVLIAVVPAYGRADKTYDGQYIEYPPTHGDPYKFYLRYLLTYPGYGTDTISFPYAPAEDRHGAFVPKSVTGGGVSNTVTLPTPSDASHKNDPLVTDVYLALRTSDSYGLTVKKGNASVRPLSGSQSYAVDPNTTALYKFSANEDFTQYTVDIRGQAVRFDETVRGELRSGMLSVFQVAQDGFTRARVSVVINVTNLSASLTAPTGLTAETVSSSSVNLSWNSVTGASFYRIYRSTSSSRPSSYLYTTSSTPYTVTGLSSGTTYYFWVSAYSSSTGEEGPLSSPASTTPSSSNSLMAPAVAEDSSW